MRIIKHIFGKEKKEYRRCVVCGRKIKNETVSNFTCDSEECDDDNYVVISDTWY